MYDSAHVRNEFLKRQDRIRREKELEETVNRLKARTEELKKSIPMMNIAEEHIEELEAENKALRKALEGLLAIEQTVISTLIGGQIPGWQNVQKEFDQAKSIIRE